MPKFLRRFKALLIAVVFPEIYLKLSSLRAGYSMVNNNYQYNLINLTLENKLRYNYAFYFMCYAEEVLQQLSS